MKARLIAASVCLSLCALMPAAARAQALTSLSSVRVGYTTRKNTVKPQGELKAQIDALDAQIAEATRLGRTGELRRLFAKGIALLNGTPWTDALDYSRSLVLRTPRVVVDSSKPYSGAARTDLRVVARAAEHASTAHVALRKRPAPPAPGQPAAEPPLVKDLGTFDGVARDLRESPFFFDLDLHDVADGAVSARRRGLEPGRADRQRVAADRAAQGRRRARGASRGRRGARRPRRCAPRSCSRSIA